MSFLELFKGGSKKASTHEILMDLQNLEKNLRAKTHIEKPKELTVLELYGKKAMRSGMETEGKTILTFCKLFMGNMVSYRRLSRTEIVSAVSEIKDKERSNAQKLVMDLK
jgi:uncharacterized protein YfbU (UPF0304 family)